MKIAISLDGNLVLRRSMLYLPTNLAVPLPTGSIITMGRVSRAIFRVESLLWYDNLHDLAIVLVSIYSKTDSAKEVLAKIYTSDGMHYDELIDWANSDNNP